MGDTDTKATERARRVEDLFRRYRDQVNYGHDRNQSVTEFMTDLAHLADSFGCDGEDRLNDAITLYEETKQRDFLIEIRDHRGDPVITFKATGYDDVDVAGESALDWYRDELSYSGDPYDDERYDEEYGR